MNKKWFETMLQGINAHVKAEKMPRIKRNTPLNRQREQENIDWTNPCPVNSSAASAGEMPVLKMAIRTWIVGDSCF